LQAVRTEICTISNAKVSDFEKNEKIAASRLKNHRGSSSFLIEPKS